MPAQAFADIELLAAKMTADQLDQVEDATRWRNRDLIDKCSGGFATETSFAHDLVLDVFHARHFR